MSPDWAPGVLRSHVVPGPQIYTLNTLSKNCENWLRFDEVIVARGWHVFLANSVCQNVSIQIKVWQNGRDRVNDVPHVTVSNALIQPSPTVKSLGVILDRQLTFDEHVASITKACLFHIRALLHVRNSLPDDVAKTVACGIIGSRLDYCNSLLVFGMSASNFKSLQRAQNTLAREVLWRGKFEHITPALIDLHWLPVQYRVTYKLATLTYSIKQS